MAWLAASAEMQFFSTLVRAGSLSAAAREMQVTTPAVPMDGGWIICGGEVRPGVRTPAVWRVTIAK